MSESARRRRSKWDIKEDKQQLPIETTQSNAAWPGKADDSGLEEEPKSGIYSKFDDGSSRGLNWSDDVDMNNDGLKYKDGPEWSPLAENNDAPQNDNVGIRSIVYEEDSAMRRDWGDGNSQSMSISPGLDPRRERNHSHSPRNTWRRSFSGRSRSQSRSRSHSRGRGRSRSRSPFSDPRHVAYRPPSRSRSPFRDPRQEAYGPSSRSRSPFRDPRHEAYGPRSRSRTPVHDSRHEGYRPPTRSRTPVHDPRHEGYRPPTRSRTPIHDPRHEAYGPRSQSQSPFNDSRHEAYGPQGRSRSPLRDSRHEAYGPQGRSTSPVHDSRHEAYGPQVRSRSPVRDSRHEGNGPQGRSRSPVRDSRHEGYGPRGRSRSPVRDSRRDSYGRNDNRSEAGEPTRPCRDFTAGRCRRGSECRFSHQEYNNRDGARSGIDSAENSGTRRDSEGASRYSSGSGNYYERDRNDQPNTRRSTNTCNDFLKGRCSRGSSCRYVHHDASGDGYDRRNRTAAYDNDRRHESHRTTAHVPCKFYAFGKCRNGDRCKFSHDGPVQGTSEGSSRDDKWAQNPDREDRSRGGGPKWSDNNTGPEIGNSSGWTRDGPVHDKKWVQNPDGENRSRGGGSRWSDSDVGPEIGNSTGWGGSDSGSMHFVNPASVIENKEGGWGNSLDNQNTTWDPLWGGDPGKDLNVNWGSGINGVSVNIPESQTPNGGLLVREQNTVQEVEMTEEPSNPNNPVDFSGNIVHAGLVTGQTLNQPISSFIEPIDQNIISPTPSKGHSFDLNGPAQPIISPFNPQVQPQFHQEEPKMIEETSVTLGNVVPAEQVPQINIISASLAQQLPQLYAVLNPSLGLSTMIGHPNPAPLAPEDKNNPPPGFSLVPVEQKTQMPLKPMSLMLPPGKLASVEPQRSGRVEERRESPKPKQHERIAKLEAKEMEAKQEKENEMGDKDDKGMRMFKVALVEFVKELLKPTWKEGQMSKEVHKTIVKKVVEKVSSTMQGAHAPKTQEKIEQYLEHSKPKLSKLVQAYVEKFTKN